MKKIWLLMVLLLVLVQPVDAAFRPSTIGDVFHKGDSGHDVRAYGAKGNGSDNDSTAFINAIAAAAGGRVIVPEAATSYKLSSNVTVPDGVMIEFQQGGVLSLDVGVTFTVNGTIQAGIYQIFNGSGTAAFAKGSCNEVYPEWWAAIGDNSTDCTAAFNSAMIAGQTVGVVKISTGTYIISSPLQQWPVANFSSMQGGMILQGNGTFSELRYTGTTDYCIEVIDPAGSSSPVASVIQDIHMSAPNVADPDDGGCIGIGASITSINRVTIDDANTATGIFVGLGSGQSIQTRINECGFYGTTRIGRAIWATGISPIINISDSFLSCKEGILAEDAYIHCNGVFIYATDCPINMDDSGLFFLNGWIEGGSSPCYFGGPRHWYKVYASVLGATTFTWESGAEVEFSGNQRDLMSTSDDASVVPDWGKYKIFPAVKSNVWDGAGLELVADADALNGYALKIDAKNEFAEICIRPSVAGEYYCALPRGTYELTLYMKDSNQLANDARVYTSAWDGSWTSTDHGHVNLTADYQPHTYLIVVDETLVASSRWHGIRWRVWRLHQSAWTNTVYISHAILKYRGPDRPGRGNLVAYNPEKSDADNARESSVYFLGRQSGGESVSLAEIEVRHDGSSDDKKGQFSIRVNDGNDTMDNLSPTFRIEADGGVFLPELKSGATQGAAGARTGELWIDTADQTIKVGT